MSFLQENYQSQEQSIQQNQLNSHEKNKNIVVLGPTGSGKSTLLNLLIGKQLINIPPQENQERTGLVCLNEFFKTSNSQWSETKEFKSFSKNLQGQGNFTFIDTPGLVDTNLIDRAYNLIKIHEYITQNESVIAFVFEVSNVESIKGDAFLKTLLFFNQIYKNLNECVDSSFFIMTKFSEVIHDKIDIMNKIKLGLKDRIETSHSDAKDIYQSLYNFVSKIQNVHTFSRPPKLQQGVFEMHIQEKVDIYQTIMKLKPLKPAENFLNEIPLDPETKDLILNELPTQFKVLKNPVDQLIVNYLTREYLLGIKKREDIKKQIQRLLDDDLAYKMEQYQILLKNFLDKEMISQESVCSLMFHYYRLNTFSVFLKEHLAEIFKIEGLSRLTESLNKEYCRDTASLFLKGYILSSSQLKGYLSEQKITQVFIQVDFFLVDCSLKNPGTTIILKCNEIFLESVNTFDFSGLKGEKILPTKADYCQGKQGNPGQAGGHFVLIANTIQCCEPNSKLYVNLNGGDGGDGQDGGDGENGKDGNDGDIEGIKNKNENLMVQAKDITSFLKDNLTYNKEYLIFYLSRGESGEDGQNSFLGGAKGRKGACGYLVKELIQQENSDLIIEIQNLSGNTEKNLSENLAKNGVHGKPGSGGKSGRDALGVYKSDYFLPCVRSIPQKMEQINESHCQLEDLMLNDKNIQEGGTEWQFYFAFLGVLGSSVISAQLNQQFVVSPHFVDSNHTAKDGQVPLSQQLVKDQQKLLRKNIQNCSKDPEICKILKQYNLLEDQTVHSCSLIINEDTSNTQLN